MAIIEQFEPSERATFRLQPTSVVCHYGIFETNSGRRILQLDTTGSRARKNPGKQSQTLQLDSRRARALWEILSKEFGIAP